MPRRLAVFLDMYNYFFEDFRNDLIHYCKIPLMNRMTFL